MAVVKSLCEKHSWLFSNIHLCHSEEANSLQWTVCLWNLALVGCLQIVRGQNAVDEYYEITQIFTGNRFQPLGFFVCLLCVVLQSCTSWSFKCPWYTIGAGSEQHYKFLLCRKLHDFFFFPFHVLEWRRIKLKFPWNKILYRKTAGEQRLLCKGIKIKVFHVNFTVKYTIV